MKNQEQTNMIYDYLNKDGFLKELAISVLSKYIDMDLTTVTLARSLKRSFMENNPISHHRESIYYSLIVNSIHRIDWFALAERAIQAVQEHDDG